MNKLKDSRLFEQVSAVLGEDDALLQLSIVKETTQILDTSREAPEGVLVGSFLWSGTRQKSMYWLDIWRSIRENIDGKKHE